MREINIKAIESAIFEMCIKANCVLPDDLAECLNCAETTEVNDLPKSVINDLKKNIKAAVELNIPICQDTGITVIFADIGQDVHLVGGDFEAAINSGVGRGYKLGNLRCSIVKDPFSRVNTGDNTPAVIHTRIVEGENIK